MQFIHIDNYILVFISCDVAYI